MLSDLGHGKKGEWEEERNEKQVRNGTNGHKTITMVIISTTGNNMMITIITTLKSVILIITFWLD